MMRQLDPSPSGKHPETIVLYSSGAIGDTIWHLPILKALAANDPSGRIDIVANERLPIRDMLGGQEVVSRYIMLPLNRRNLDFTRVKFGFLKDVEIAAKLLPVLWRGRYRRMFILVPSRSHVIAAYTLLARLTGIPEVYGYAAGDMQARLLTASVPVKRENRYLFPRYLAQKLLDVIGIPYRHENIILRPDRRAVEAVETDFAGFPKPWVAFAVGSTEQNRIWAPERMAAVADALWRQGYRSLFLLGAPHETKLAQDIVTACAVAQPVCVTNRPLTDSIALLSRCDFAFCTDSGLMNIGAALGIPVYVLFATVEPYTYSCYLHPITPEGGIDKIDGVKKITVERALAKLREAGILKGA